MRIGIHADIFIEWAGGIDFLRIILKGLNQINKHTPLVVFVFIPEKKIAKLDHFKVSVKRLINKVLGSQKYSLQLPKPLDIEGAKKTLAQDCDVQFVTYPFHLQNLEKELIQRNIDILLPCFHSVGKGFSVPWVGYLYDFQHKYFPHFFSKKELRLRDNLFSEMQDAAKVIMVNAQAVKNDVHQFFPQTKANIIALPFCPLYKGEGAQTKDVPLPEDLPQKYFLISNQFWQHKDHITAIKAMALFHEQYKLADIHLICTGEMHDYRAPGYIQSIQDLVKELQLEGKIHFLGYITKELQLSIMKNAISLVQPTLFEGGPGGGAVYEALAMGIRVVLSDIPVNKEISRSNCLFFEARNPHSLANKMFEIISMPKLTEVQIAHQQGADLNNFSDVLHKLMLKTVKLRSLTNE
jgi:glycosyltransferase involved in cell wall biosynthesis